MIRTIIVLFFCLLLFNLFFSSQAQAAEVRNELFFTADLNDIYGTGSGFFDPTQDELNLMGLDWVGAKVIEDESDRWFEEDPFNPGIFYATMVILGEEGDSTKWKCKADPENRFFNWGWEISPDYWYIIQSDGFIAEIELKPNIFPIQPPIEAAVTVLFQVDMTGANNYYTQDDIDHAAVEWVGLKGQNSVLGSWAGAWLPSDTLASPKMLHVLRDQGQNGDKVAGDFIFSALVEFPAGNEGGPGLFKYGAYYEGALEVNNGQSPLDNEMHGTDHWINIKVGGQTEILNRFGVIREMTSVPDKNNRLPGGFKLAQNYPNPFNPMTTIDYFLPTNSNVELCVYNLQGQKIATLVDEQQSQGAHSLTFKATNLPIGIYFFRLNTKDSQTMKKMIIVK